MFDPTIYENVKVVMEGAIYDHDLDGVIMVTGRDDFVNLANLSRIYSIRFTLVEDESVSAEIRIAASIDDFAAEKLKLERLDAGCQLDIIFDMEIQDVNRDCANIASRLLELWENRPIINQRIHFTYGEQKTTWHNQILLHFGRKVNEDQIADFPVMINFIIDSLRDLVNLKSKKKSECDESNTIPSSYE